MHSTVSEHYERQVEDTNQSNSK